MNLFQVKMDLVQNIVLPTRSTRLIDESGHLTRLAWGAESTLPPLGVRFSPSHINKIVIYTDIDGSGYNAAHIPKKTLPSATWFTTTLPTLIVKVR